MRSFRFPVLSLVCVGLLTAQLTGLHMHMNAHGYVGVPVGTHVHRSDVHADERARIAHTEEANHDHHRGDPDHDGDRDVSVIELAAGVLKLLIFVAFVVLALVVVLRPGIRIRMPALAPRPRPRHERWRPPLRAPPIFSRPPSCCAQ
jgi:hypothetical protein